MIIRSEGIGRTFECVLHFAGYSHAQLYVASFAGPASAATALAANIIEGRRTVIVNDAGRVMHGFYPTSGQYKRIETKVGDIYHCMVIHKSTVFSENSPNPTIIAEDGDIRKAVGWYMTARFPVPPEWEESYLDILECDEINVVKNPLIGVWDGLKVVKIISVKGTGFSGLTDESVIAGVKWGIKKGLLKIPESDFEGKFDPSWSMKEYLKANAGILSGQLQRVSPKHDPGTGKLHQAIGQMERIPFPAQGHAVQGLINVLKGQGMAVACGDMGTGSVKRSAIRAY